MKFKPNKFLVASIVLAAALSSSVMAQTTWNGATDGTWGTATNWSAGVPDSTDLVTYGAGSGVGTAVANGTQTLDAARAVLGFTVGNNAASPITINSGTGSNTLTIGTSGILLNSGTGGDITFNADLALAGAQTWTTGNTRDITATNVNLNGNLLSTNIAGSGFITINGVISGTGGITRAGGGAALFTLSNTASTFGGQVTLTGGTTVINKLAVIGSNSSFGTGSGASSIIMNGATLTTLNYTGTTTDTTNRAIDMRASATINNNGTGGQVSFTAANVTQGGTASARTLTLGGSNANANTLGSILGNSGTGTNITSLTKTDAGTWILTGANTYTGTTSISQGALRVTGTGVVGGATGSILDANNIVFGTGNANATLEFETSANLGAADQIRFRNTSGTAGQGAQLKYIGTTAQVVSKAIQCDTGVGVRLSSDSVGGSVDFSGSWANVTGNRPIYLGGTGTGDNTISGNISANGSGTLTKVDGGKWILSGTNNYTGATKILEGTLLIGTSGSLGNTTVTVGGTGATGTPTLAGGGTIGGATTIAAAAGGVVGTHSVGVTGVSNGVGTQTFSNTLSYGAGSIFEWNFQAIDTSNIGVKSNADTGTYDKVVANGTLSGSGAVLQIVLGGNFYSDAFWNSNKSWTDIYSGTGTGVGSWGSIFASIAGDSIVWNSGNSRGEVGTEGYFTVGGSTLSWTAVPEPTSALAGFLIIGGLLRRRRVG